MKHSTGMLKRCLAMILTFAMIITSSGFNSLGHVHAAETTVTLGTLIADNYAGNLSTEEKSIITSGALSADRGIVYATPLETDTEGALIAVTEGEKLVTVKTFTDDHGNLWVPQSFDIVVEGVTKNDNIVLTKKTENTYEGNYTYDQNMFSVVVTYSLDITVNTAEQEKVLGAGYELAQDIAMLQKLDKVVIFPERPSGNLSPEQVAEYNKYDAIKEMINDQAAMDLTAQAVLKMLIMQLPLLDDQSAIDLIGQLITGIPVELPDGTTETIAFNRSGKAAAQALLNEVEANGGKLALDKFLFDRSLENSSYLEWLLYYGSDLESSLDSTFESIKGISDYDTTTPKGLTQISSQLSDLLFWVEQEETNAWTTISTTAQEYGYTITNETELNNAISQIPASKQTAFDALNGKLTEAGMAEKATIASKADIEDLIGELNDAKEAMLAEIRSQLAAAGYGTEAANITSTSAVKELSNTLTSKEQTIYNNINAKLKAMGQAEVNDIAGVNSVISTLEGLAALGMNVTETLEQAKQARDALAAIENVKAAVNNAVGALEKLDAAIAMLQDAVAALEKLEQAEAKLKELQTLLEKAKGGKAEIEEKLQMLEILILILQNFCKTVEPVVNSFATDTWKSDEALNIASINSLAVEERKAVYTTLTTNATGLGQTGAVVTNPLHVTEATVMYNMSMFNVTMKATAWVVGEDNSQVAQTQQNKVVTFRKDASREEIKAVIDAFEADALVAWNDVIDDNYEASTSDLNALVPATGLDADITYEISYSPKDIKVTYGEGYDIDEETKPYGWKLTLEKAETGYAYSYLVNGVRKNQGTVIKITAPVTISRTKGEATQYKTVTDLVVNTDLVTPEEETFLSSPALVQGKQFWLVTPKDASLIDQSKAFTDKIITAEYVDAELGDLVWVPVSAVTYKEGTQVLENLTFNGKVAQITDPGYNSIKVIYELQLSTDALADAEISVADVLAKMNLRDSLAKEYNAQEAALNQLLTQREYLSKLGSEKVRNALGTATQLKDIKQESVDTINGILAQIDEVKAETGTANLRLYDQLTKIDTDTNPNSAGFGKVDNMLYFYKNSKAVIDQVNYVLGMINVVNNDPVVWNAVESNGYGEMFTELSAQFSNLTLPAVNEVIDVNSTAFENLLAMIQTAAAGQTNTYDATALSNMVWKATVSAPGADSMEVPVTLKVEGVGEVSDTITLKVGSTVTAGNLKELNELIAQLEATFAGSYGAIDQVHYTKTENLLAEGATLTGAEKVTITWTAKKYQVKGDVIAEITYANPTITLPGSGNDAVRYEYSYSYLNAESENETKVQKVSTLDQTYSFDKAIFDLIFKDGSVTIKRTEINAAKEDLITDVDEMDSATLFEKDGKYALVLPVSLNQAELEKDLSAFVMALFMGQYNSIEIGGRTLYTKSENQYSLQALLDAIFESGVGTETIIKMSPLKLEGYEFIGGIDRTDLGGKLIQTTMKLDNTEMDFYITLKGDISRVQSALVKARPYFSAICENGTINATVTLPNEVYAAYLAALTMTGEVDMHNINAVNNEVALGYLLTVLNPILDGGNVTLETFGNTIAKFGKTVDLSSYEQYYGIFKKYYDASKVSYTNDIASLPLEDIMIQSLIAKLQGIVDAKAGALGMEPGSIDLSKLIKEYETGLNVTLTADLTNTDTDYAALAIDVNNQNVILAKSGNIGDIANAQYILLLDDITGNITVNTTSISVAGRSIGANVLDLNGHAVTGNVTGANLWIVDNVYTAGAVGRVTGDVSVEKVLGGAYDKALAAEMLPTGYVQDTDGTVRNELYTIMKDTTGTTPVTTITLNPSTVVKELATKESAVNLAVELALDLVMNHFNTAALTVNGHELVKMKLDDIVDLATGENRMDNVISTALGCISAPAMADLVDDIVKDLTNFSKMEEALSDNGDGVMATYTTQTAPWALKLYPAEGNYLTLDILASDEAALQKTGEIKFVMDRTGDLADELKETAGALADTTTVSSDLELEDLVLEDSKIIVKGSYDGSIVIDLTAYAQNAGKAGYPDHTVMMALILAYGNRTANTTLKNALVAGIQDFAENGWRNPSDLKAAMEGVSITDIAEALANTTRTVTIPQMASALGLTDTVPENLKNDTNALGFDTVIDVLGFILRRVDVASSRTLGGVPQPAYGVYELAGDKAVKGSKDIAKGYGVSYDLQGAVSVTLKLFQIHECVPGTPVKENEVPASCTVNGSYDEVVYCTQCGEEISRTTKPIEATGKHDYVTEFIWAQNLSSAQMKVTCSKEDMDAVYVVCTMSIVKLIDRTVYTATAEFDGQIYTDTKEVMRLPEVISDPALAQSDLLLAWKLFAVNQVKYADTVSGIDTVDGILMLDTAKSGMTVAQIEALLSAVVKNDADGKPEFVCHADATQTSAELAEEELVKNGAVLEVIAENALGSTSTRWLIIVLGDTNCNGGIDSGDAVLMTYQYQKERDLTGAALIAADTNRTEAMESGDAVLNSMKYKEQPYESPLLK